jgi:hypothetical protein
MIVNLYVDHMINQRPQSAEDVWNATHEHSRIYTDAARKIGLSNAEYEEFRNDLLDGRAIYVKVPTHLDAMAGYRHGDVYVVRRAVITTPNVMGWEVVLRSGAKVYVPQLCGNLSLLRPAVVAHHVRKPRHIYTIARRVVPTPAPTEQPVVIAPPAPTPVPVAPIAATATHRTPWWLLLLPIPILFNNSPHEQPPPCTGGSNALGVCQTSSTK